MAGLNSISDIFKKDQDGNYINRNAKLARKILSYVFVNQDLQSSVVYSKPFYDRKLAGWLLDNYNEFIDHYQYRPYNKMNYASKVEEILQRINKSIHDLCRLGLIKCEMLGKRRGTSDNVVLYSYTVVGYVMALLIELIDQPGKRNNIAQEIYTIFESYFKENASSYAIFYLLLFKKYMEAGVFDEFLNDVLLYRLTQGTEVMTKDNLFCKYGLTIFC